MNTALGFQIEYAENTENQPPIPVTEILASPAERIEYVKTGLRDGTIHSLEIAENPAPSEALYESADIIQLPRAAYRAAVDEGLIPDEPDSFLDDGRLLLLDDSNRGKYSALLPEEQAKSFEEMLKQYMLVNPEGYESLERAYLVILGSIKQAFTLEAFGQTFPLYNFNDEPLAHEQLAAICNATRAAVQRTGGGILERLKMMAVLPGFREDDENDQRAQFLKGLWAENKTKAMAAVGGVLLNAAQLHVEEKDSDLFAVDDLESTVVHELDHINSKLLNEPKGSIGPFAKAVGWRFSASAGQEVYEGAHPHPSKYGSTAGREDEAETAAALHSGREDLVSRDRRAAKQAVWDETHSGAHGPAYIKCKEIDLGDLRKRGVKLGMPPPNLAMRLTTAILLT